MKTLPRLISLALVTACGDDPAPSASGSASEAAPTTTSTTTSTTVEPAGEETAPPLTDAGASPTPCAEPCAEPWELDGDLRHSVYDDDDHDLSAYACLTVIHGSLSLDDVPAEQLVHLRHLRRVDGYFGVDLLPGLVDLSAFACLESVGALFVRHNSLVKADLPSLRWAPDVTLWGVPLPSFAPEFAGVRRLELAAFPDEDLDAVASWTSLGDLKLEVGRAHNVTSVAGLAQLVAGAPSSVWIYDMPALKSLHGLETMTTPRLLAVTDLPQLSELWGLTGVVSAGSIVLDRLENQSSFAGLNNLVSVERLQLSQCHYQPKVTSFFGLDALAEVDRLNVELSSLKSFAGAPKLKRVRQLSVNTDPGPSQAAIDALLAQLAEPPESVSIAAGCGPDH